MNRERSFLILLSSSGQGTTAADDLRNRYMAKHGYVVLPVASRDCAGSARAHFDQLLSPWQAWLVDIPDGVLLKNRRVHRASCESRTRGTVWAWSSSPHSEEAQEQRRFGTSWHLLGLQECCRAVLSKYECEEVSCDEIRALPGDAGIYRVIETCARHVSCTRRLYETVRWVHHKD